MTTILSNAEAHKLGLAPKPSKYRAVKMTLDGVRFDSKREALEYARLKMLQGAKLITNLERQTVFPIEINGKRVCEYRADFTWTDETGARRAIDIKGFDTPVSRLKRKLVEAVHGIEIEIVR